MVTTTETRRAVARPRRLRGIRLFCYVCDAPATATASCGVCHRQGEYRVCDAHTAPACPSGCRVA